MEILILTGFHAIVAVESKKLYVIIQNPTPLVDRPPLVTDTVNVVVKNGLP